MHERELRKLIEGVRAGRVTRRSFIARMVSVGLTAPMARMLLMHAGRRERAASQALQADQGAAAAGRSRLLLWQARDAAQPAFRHRHQGPGRLAHLLRAARRLGRATAT